MSQVMNFLESVACRQGFIAGREYERAIVALDVEPSLRQALLVRDRKALAAALQGRSAMFCMVFTPDEGEPENAPTRKDDDGEEEAQPAPDKE
jgi:hypothetical protein